PLHCDTAAALCADVRSQAADHIRVIVTNLEQHLCTSRDDTRRAGVEGDAAGSPYRAWPAGRGEAIVDINAKSGQRDAGILANAHPGRARVILLTSKCDPELPDTNDGGDDADLETTAFERLALLDMRLEIS